MRYILILFIGLLLLPLFCVPVGAQENRPATGPKVNLEVKQATLQQVLAEIEKQTGMFFSYESSLLADIGPVSFIAREEPLEDCLKRLFLPFPLMFQVKGRTIILKKKPRQIVINGFIRDKASSESLVGASVYQPTTRKGTASNSFGFFSLSLDPGDIQLNISYIGYQTTQVVFPFMERDTLITIEMVNNTALEEVVVVASGQEKQPLLNTQMGAMEINQKTIRNTPVLFGEADIIKTLQLTPGVTAGAEGFSGMYVRGGNVDENLFLIDGNPVYQIGHIGGIFSAFNPEAIRGMEFFKAGFPARYGGRLSSVVDVHTREGNMKEYHGSASIGLISGNASFEGPIVKDKTSFMVALRHTWLDVLTAPALFIANRITKKDGDKAHARYAFYDLNLKLNHRFSERSRMFFSLYNGKDILRGGFTEFHTQSSDTPFEYYTDSSMDWGNLMATVGWTYVFNPKLFGKLSGVYTQYNSTIKMIHDDWYGRKDTEGYTERYDETSSQTGIMDFGVRSSFDYIPSANHHVRFGGDMMVHRFRPEYSRYRANALGETNLQDMNVVFTDDKLWAKEFSVFAEDDWTLSPSLRLNGGLRYSLFHIDNKTYMSLEPRLSMRWLLRKDLSLKASFSRMNQYVHLISNSFINLPTDAWMPVTQRLKPLYSDQLSLGVYYNLNNEYDFSMEGYYKRLNNLLEYRDGYSFLPTFSSWEDKLAVGKGRAYGLEWMARKQTGKTTGWVGYALSWADRKFPDVNNGERFPAKYDNRHKINVVVMHKVSPKVELSAAWTYASGNRMTLSLENYESVLSYPQYQYGYGGVDYIEKAEELSHLEKRNNYQLPAYHRLDLGINIYRPKKNGRMGIWNVSIYNAYSRMNPLMVHKSHKGIPVWVPPTEEGGGYGTTRTVPVFKKVSILPILPSITYTYKF